MKKFMLVALAISILAVSIIIIVPGLSDSWLNIGAGKIAPSSSVHQSDFGEIMGGTISHEIILNMTLPNVPENVMVYRTLKPDVSREAITAFGKKFGITGRINDGDRMITIESSDSPRSVTFSKVSGSAEFHNETGETINEPLVTPENLPTEKQAVLIAKKFLQEKDLYPVGMAASEIKYKIKTGTDSKGNEVSRQEMIYVMYNRSLNGLNVEGTIINVGIVGKSGNVVNYYARWRNYEPYKELPLKSPEQALSELKVNGVNAGVQSPGNVIIDEMYLAYYTKPGTQHEDYLEPVYVFKGHSDAGKVNEMIPALKEVPTELISL